MKNTKLIVIYLLCLYSWDILNLRKENIFTWNVQIDLYITLCSYGITRSSSKKHQGYCNPSGSDHGRIDEQGTSSDLKTLEESLAYFAKQQDEFGECFPPNVLFRMYLRNEKKENIAVCITAFHLIAVTQTPTGTTPSRTDSGQHICSTP